jgi:peptidoglycan/xylan/chitin deacetylase (PgdA/CDA1 family)
VSPKHSIVKVGRGALCAGALLGGAALAHLGLPMTVGPVRPAAAAAIEGEADALAEEGLSRLEMGTLDAPVRPPDDPDPTGRAFRDGRIISGATRHRLILFTFDDGPDQRTTPTLLDFLDAEDIKAVFFVTTNRFDQPMPWYRRNADLVREIAARGHLVGNHTVSHQELPALDDVGVAHELDAAARTIEATIGERPWLLRPPGGSHSPRTDGFAAMRGYTTLLWNLGAGDFQVESAEQVFQTFVRVLERREREDGQRGGVVLLHDTYPRTVEAFPRIVRFLRTRNCELLERGEELYDFVDDPSFFFTPRGHAAPTAEAASAELDPDVLAFRQERLREETRRRCPDLMAR